MIVLRLCNGEDLSGKISPPPERKEKQNEKKLRLLDKSTFKYNVLAVDVSYQCNSGSNLSI